MSDRATVVVGIGRKVGDEPMDAARWDRFKRQTRDKIERKRGGTVYFAGEGTGYFEGAEEPSYTVVASLGKVDLVGLYYDLGELARAYDQRSIALTTGTTAFPPEGMVK